MAGRRSRTIDVDESLEGWVLIPSADGALVGRLECSEGEIKKEQLEGKIPRATLRPLYIETHTEIPFFDDGGRVTAQICVRGFERLERKIGLEDGAGIEEELSQETALVNFVWLSKAGLPVRRLYVRRIQDAEHKLKNGASKIQLATRPNGM